jgi:hypothetical protein
MHPRTHALRALCSLALLISASACGGVVTTSGTDSGTPSEDAPPGSCGGKAGTACPTGMWCSYADGTCNNPDAAGTCRKREALPCPGPMPGSAVCGCDGTTYGSACEAHSSSQSIAYTGTCKGPPPDVCGGSTGISCATGKYCDFGDGRCPAPGSSGICALKPTGCDFTYAPVCGCDGKTHPNACEAHSSGVTIASTGECGTTPKSCGGFAGATCASNEYCDWGVVPSLCGGDDGTGLCKLRPTSCVPEDGVWCACDGKIYESTCAAAKAGEGVRKNGPC